MNPNYPTAHHWYALLLGNLGRFDEAKREILRAQQLDPLSLIINRTVGNVCFWAREYDQALEQFKKTLEIDPNFPGMVGGMSPGEINHSLCLQAAQLLQEANHFSEANRTRRRAVWSRAKELTRRVAARQELYGVSFLRRVRTWPADARAATGNKPGKTDRATKKRANRKS